MIESELRALYRKAGVNAITPTVLETKVLPYRNTVVELSVGSPIKHGGPKPYGVSVFVWNDDGTPDYKDKNRHHGCYYDEAEARRHYEEA